MERRFFPASLLAAVAGGGLLGAAAEMPPALPPAGLRVTDAERYWQQIRAEQFSLPEGRNFLNNGSLGVVPRPVLRAVAGYLERAASLELEEYPRWGYETLEEERAAMADFLGCPAAHLAFTHNCTESMSFIANGLTLRQGDEVLLTDQEHPGGRSCWELLAARQGVVLREVAIPHPPKSAADLVERMVSAIGPRTKVLSFSGILTKTGIIMPVRQICEAARAKGVTTVVDGAHMNGQVPVKLAELGCDYYAGSPHKWMFAPAGCGILYGRDGALDRLWPTVVTSGWNDAEHLHAARFQMVGTNNRALIKGAVAGVQFLKDLGPEHVYQRIHHLARYTYQAARKRPYATLLSPADDSMYGSLVCLDLAGSDDQLATLWKRCQEEKIWLLSGRRLRLSSHIHTRPTDIDAFFALADGVLG
jgi:selenocysteine lyase/cysteine desulfurase